MYVATSHLMCFTDPKPDLSTIPDEVYGKSSGSASEVVRQGTLSVVETNQIVLMWVLLTIESQVVSFQKTRKDKQLSILARRAEIYRLMFEKAMNEDNRPLDFVFTLAIAASCELRMSNPLGAEHHIGAAKKLLALQGGFKAIRDITYPLGLMVLSSLVELSIPNLFDSLEELRSKLEAMVQRLRDYQTWNYKLRRGQSYHPTIGVERKIMSSSKEREADSSLDQLAKRIRAFNKDSPLGHYVALPPGELTEAQFRFSLSILYAMNTAFWDFRDNTKTSDEYLKELTTAAELSITANFVLRAGGSKLPSLLMLILFAHKAAKAEGRHPSTSKVFHVEEVFEFVNLAIMAGPVIRMRVLKALSSWLTSGYLNLDDLTHLSDKDFDILREEVENTWLSDQARCLAERRSS